MKRIRFLGAHRNWEDWLGLLLGLGIGLSPWIPGQMGSQEMMINAVVVGTLVFIVSEFEAVNLHRWEEGALIALGLWLGASPFIFGYSGSGMLRFLHFAFAASLVLLGGIELWQDWNLTAEELTEHEN